MFTWSEDPYKDMWNHLKFLGKVNNARRLLIGDIKSNRQIVYSDGLEAEKKAKQISMCINQADEYFQAANLASINTSPLLFFYGMLSLSKALIVANKPGISLEEIQYHGLHTRPQYEHLRTYKENPLNWSMEEEYALTNGGVFRYLTEILDGFVFEDNTLFRFKDILSVCAEISGMYEKFYNDRSQILNLFSHTIETEPKYSITICSREKDKSEVISRIPELAIDFTMSEELKHGKARIFISKDLTKFPDYLGLYNSNFGGRYIVGGVNYFHNTTINRKHLNPASLDYVAMFILSICVRYKHDFWGTVVEGNRSGVLGLIELFISVIKRRFPNTILDNLFGEEFRYGSPGYIT